MQHCRDRTFGDDQIEWHRSSLSIVQRRGCLPTIMVLEIRTHLLKHRARSRSYQRETARLWAECPAGAAIPALSTSGRSSDRCRFCLAV